MCLQQLDRVGVETAAWRLGDRGVNDKSHHINRQMKPAVLYISLIRAVLLTVLTFVTKKFAAVLSRIQTWQTVMGMLMFRYKPQAEGMDESRTKQELKKINAELLKKLQDLDTDIIFSTG